jgi:hypothetical protein
MGTVNQFEQHCNGRFRIRERLAVNGNQIPLTRHLFECLKIRDIYCHHFPLSSKLQKAVNRHGLLSQTTKKNRGCPKEAATALSFSAQCWLNVSGKPLPWNFAPPAPALTDIVDCHLFIP